MEGETLTVGFLSCKPNIYEFLYNVSCQISDTFMFSEVAPIVIEDMICFLIYKHIDVSKFEAYRAIDSILNNNIYNFINRYGIDFDQHFKNYLQLVRARTMDDTFSISS